jgi:hypothetical protein
MDFRIGVKYAGMTNANEFAIILLDQAVHYSKITLGEISFVLVVDKDADIRVLQISAGGPFCKPNDCIRERGCSLCRELRPKFCCFLRCKFPAGGQ